jgi:hypothetical protein
MNDEHESHRPEEDAARLGLVVVGEAAALHSGDEAALDASEENIRETVDDLIDEPLTPRQEEIVQRLAAAGGTLTAGLSGALAAQTGRSVEDVLGGAAGAVIWQERMAAQRYADAAHDAGHDGDTGHVGRDGRDDRVDADGGDSDEGRTGRSGSDER